MKNDPVSVCGELAGDPLFAPLLIGLGATDLSVSLGSLAHIKYMIRRISIHDAKHLAIRVLRCNTAKDIEQQLTEFNQQVMGETLSLPEMV
jgi:phosphoenolpyruvate-protein kinase (PTS system EI component)